MAIADVTVLSEFWSEDKKLKAEVVYVEVEEGQQKMFARLFEDGFVVKYEHYEGKSEQFYEDAAENFVMGVKKLD